MAINLIIPDAGLVATALTNSEGPWPKYPSLIICVNLAIISALLCGLSYTAGSTDSLPVALSIPTTL